MLEARIARISGRCQASAPSAWTMQRRTGHPARAAAPQGEVYYETFVQHTLMVPGKGNGLSLAGSACPQYAAVTFVRALCNQVPVHLRAEEAGASFEPRH